MAQQYLSTDPNAGAPVTQGVGVMVNGQSMPIEDYNADPARQQAPPEGHVSDLYAPPADGWLQRWANAGPLQAAEGIADLSRGNLARGAHEVITGAGLTAAPAVLPYAAVTAPLATLSGLLFGAGGQAVTRRAAVLMGAEPDTADLAGDVGGIMAGGAASQVPRAYRVGRDVLQRLSSMPQGTGVAADVLSVLSPRAGATMRVGQRVRDVFSTPDEVATPTAPPAEPRDYNSRYLGVLRQVWMDEHGGQEPPASVMRDLMVQARQDLRGSRQTPAAAPAAAQTPEPRASARRVPVEPAEDLLRRPSASPPAAAKSKDPVEESRITPSQPTPEQRAHVRDLAARREADVRSGRLGAESLSPAGGRTTTARVGGETHEIPEAWLMGRALMLRRDGLNEREAYQQAVQDWAAQAPAAPPAAAVAEAPPAPPAAARTRRSTRGAPAEASTVPPPRTKTRAPRSALPTTPVTLEDLSITPAELAQGAKWADQGVPPEEILSRILSSRELTGKLGLQTPDQVKARINKRNDSGRWPDE